MRQRRFPALPLLLLAGALAGCAAGARGDAKGDTAPAIASAMPMAGSPARSAVAAFARICARLDRAEVTSRAAGFGFVPIQTDRLPPSEAAMLRESGSTLFVRPVGGMRIMLVWRDDLHCELMAGDLDPGEVETEFARLLDALERTPDLAVVRLTSEQVAQADRQASESRLRQAAVIAPRALVQGVAGSMALRVVPDATKPLRVTMIHRVFTPAAAPPASQPRTTPDPATLMRRTQWRG